MRAVFENICKKLSLQLEKNIQCINYSRIYGGDINDAFQLETNTGFFFLKLNAIEKKEMFEKEMGGLIALASANHTLHIPKPILCGVTGSHTFLIMEWLEKGNAGKDFWKKFGEGLAQLHRNNANCFGWNEDNYIGNLNQCNSENESWAEFYAALRILPLFRRAYDNELCAANDVKNAESLCEKFIYLFPAEPPALLHGDLWGGNFMIAKNGLPAVFDPAVYYGHREMDIGMTKLFGGFDLSFYDYYNESFPLEKGWRERIALCKLYPLLVHLILFGGHYYYSVKEIVEKYR